MSFVNLMQSKKKTRTHHSFAATHFAPKRAYICKLIEDTGSKSVNAAIVLTDMISNPNSGETLAHVQTVR